MHGNQPAGAQFPKYLNCFIRAHMKSAKRLRMVRADGQEGDLRRADFSDLSEAIVIGTVARVVQTPALMFQYEAPIAPMMVAQDARPPVFAWSQSYFPIPVREALPPLQ